MVLSTFFNNISIISWRSILLVEEIGVPGETTDLQKVVDKLYHIMLFTSSWARFELTTSVMIGTDFRCSCKSHYHTITITTVSGKLSATSPNLPVKYAWKALWIIFVTIFVFIKVTLHFAYNWKVQKSNNKIVYRGKIDTLTHICITVQ